LANPKDLQHMSAEKQLKKVYYLTFPPETSNKPVVSDLTRHYDLCFNILKAQITPRQEGQMTLELFGSRDSFEQGLDYLRSNGITIIPIDQKISRDEDSCIHCGACTALCPTRALHIDPDTRLILFDTEKCSACGMCTNVCPVKAMEILLENGQ
jgi:L-aspartate semialdehyde sulfurtransferase ferredoxin